MNVSFQRCEVEGKDEKKGSSKDEATLSLKIPFETKSQFKGQAAGYRAPGANVPGARSMRGN
jgi:hypothetical protein